MGWREVLAAEQANPPPGRVLDRIVDQVWPGARVISVTALSGGLGSSLHRLDLDAAPVDALVLRRLLEELGGDSATARIEVAAHEVMHAAGVAVPRVWWHDVDGGELGRPSLLLGFVAGTPLISALDTESGRAGMAGVLRDIARIDLTPGRGIPHLASVEAIINRGWDVPVAAELVDARALLRSVADADGAFVPGRRAVHFDLHGGNVLWDGQRVTGVLDWGELAMGNPLQDEAYAWFDTCLAHGRAVGDALQLSVDAVRPGAQPTGDEQRLWRGVAMLRGLPTPAAWTDAYRAAGMEIDESTVEARFVELVEDHLQGG